MRAVLCTKPQDDLSTTTVSEVPMPEPGPGDIRVKMYAASLNPVDWKLCAGVEPWWDKPHIVGLDGAGVVDALGEGVTNVKVGDRVMWHGNLNRDGVFADYAITASHVVSHIPDDVGFEAAAALPCAGLTAFQAIVRKMRIAEGQTVVVQGASGGVGGFALQIAHIVGARTIALVRPENEARARKLGADEVLDYRDTDLRPKIRALTNDEGADAVVEVVNPRDARKTLELLRYNGQMVTTDPLPDLSKTPAYTYAASIHEVALGGAYGAGDMRTQRDFSVMGDQLLAWVSEGKLDAMVEEVITLDQAPDYLRRLRQRAFNGKAVIRF